MRWGSQMVHPIDLHVSFNILVFHGLYLIALLELSAWCYLLILSVAQCKLPREDVADMPTFACLVMQRGGISYSTPSEIKTQPPLKADEGFESPQGKLLQSQKSTPVQPVHPAACCLHASLLEVGTPSYKG